MKEGHVIGLYQSSRVFSMLLSRFQERATLFAMKNQWTQYRKAEGANFRACIRDRGILSSREGWKSLAHTSRSFIRPRQIARSKMAPPPVHHSHREGGENWHSLRKASRWCFLGICILFTEFRVWWMNTFRTWFGWEESHVEMKGAGHEATPCTKQSTTFLYSWRSLDQM